jgi:hypothetical protein
VAGRDFLALEGEAVVGEDSTVGKEEEALGAMVEALEVILSKPELYSALPFFCVFFNEVYDGYELSLSVRVVTKRGMRSEVFE